MRRLWTRLRTSDLGLLVQNGMVLTVTPKTVPMFGSFVLHMKWCV